MDNNKLKMKLHHIIKIFKTSNNFQIRSNSISNSKL